MRSKTDNYFWPDAYSLPVSKAQHKVMASCPFFSFSSSSLPFCPSVSSLSWPWLNPSRTMQKSRVIAPVRGFLGGILGLYATASLTETHMLPRPTSNAVSHKGIDTSHDHDPETLLSKGAGYIFLLVPSVKCRFLSPGRLCSELWIFQARACYLGDHVLLKRHTALGDWTIS